MDTALELLPLIAFFAAYLAAGLYPATAVLMAGSLLVLVVHRIRYGKFKDLHVVTAVLVVVLGTATLLLRDKRFIQWKPTVLFGVLSLALLVSSVLGKRPLIQRMLTATLPGGVTLSKRSWNGLNLLWAVWFALVAAANLYVAQRFSENVWVHFHTYGVSVATLLFMLPQMFWLASRTSTDAAGPS